MSGRPDQSGPGTPREGDGAPALANGDVPQWHRRPLRYRVIKRALDLAVAVPLLVLSLPLQLLIGLLIRLDSPGPALFRHQRVGLERRLFTFLKFRTMYADARQRFPELYELDASAEDTQHRPFKAADDPRLTRVGRWLRRTSLDELPNLLHVISGKMSLVGPRPEGPRLLPLYAPEHFQNFRVKPGMTGLPQVRGRNRLTIRQTLDLDLEYARKASPRLDLSLLFRTIVVVIGCRGAY